MAPVPFDGYRRRLAVLVAAGLLVAGMVAPAASEAQIVQVTLGIDGMV